MNPAAFAKRNLVASNPFRNVCYSYCTVTKILLISAFPLISGNWGLQKGSLSDSRRQVIDLVLMLFCDIWSTSLHFEFLLFFLFFLFFSLKPHSSVYISKLFFYCWWPKPQITHQRPIIAVIDLIPSVHRLCPANKIEPKEQQVPFLKLSPSLRKDVTWKRYIAILYAVYRKVFVLSNQVPPCIVTKEYLQCLYDWIYLFKKLHNQVIPLKLKPCLFYCK